AVFSLENAIHVSRIGSNAPPAEIEVGTNCLLGTFIDDRQLLTACTDRGLRVIDVDKASVVRELNVGKTMFYDIVLSADHRSAFVAEQNDGVSVVDLASGERRQLWKANDVGAIALAASTDRKLLAAFNGNYQTYFTGITLMSGNQVRTIATSSF